MKSLCWTVPAAVACLGLAAGQSIPRDEIRARVVPYVPPSQVTVRTEVRLVEVPVVVRDGQRHTVAGLTQDDFEIYDDGKKQAITAFSVQSFTTPADTAGGSATADTSEPKPQTRPRFVALCFDDFHLDLNALKPAKEAAERFVTTSLAPGDRVAVVTTSRSGDTVFTGDVPKLLDQIAKVNPAARGVLIARQLCPPIRPEEAYRIANNQDPGDAALAGVIAECVACRKPPRGFEGIICPTVEMRSLANAAWEHTRSNSSNTLRVIDGLVGGMAELPGQRTILLTSSEFFIGTLEVEVDRLLAKALHSEVVINTLDARGLYGSEGSDADGLAALAGGTGGVFYHKNNDLKRGFRELGMAPETMYLLSFRPSEGADGGFHKLKVRLVARKHDSVQARLGYTATAAPASPGVKFDREVMASDTIADLPASFTWEQRAGQQAITMIAHLDTKRLYFKPFQGRKTQRLIIVVVLRDSQGHFGAGERTDLDLSFREATFALAKSGFTAAMTIEAPPGSYSVRAVAQDAMENKLATASGAVQIK